MKRVRQLALWCAGAIVIPVFIHGCVSTTAHMSGGERLYRANCSSCHRLIEPEEHDAATWGHYVEEYGPNLDDATKRQILVFLTQEE